MVLFRAVAFVLFLVCSFVLLNIGMVAYDHGKESVGWLMIATGLANIVVSLFRVGRSASLLSI